MQGRQEKTFAKRLEKGKKKTETPLRKLGAREFACEPDARIAAEKWLQEKPQFRFSFLDIRHTRWKKRGGKGMAVRRHIVSEIEYDPAVVDHLRQKLGRFVLATNDRDLSPDELLANYKEQGTVERGFRFLKDASFRVVEIYLKEPSRIQALAMIMMLCLFVYTMTEFRLRRKLPETGDNGDRPDEEADPEPDPEMDVLPLSASQGTPVPGRRDRDGACYEPDSRTVEDTPAAWGGV